MNKKTCSFIFGILLVVLALLVSCESPESPDTNPPVLVDMDAKKKGMHFADWDAWDGTDSFVGFYRAPETDRSLQNLANTGANWTSIVVTRTQETYMSTEISHTTEYTAADSEIRRVVDLAHGMGLRVMLWPGLILSNDEEHWWGDIGTGFDNEEQWDAWFSSYSESINHYAMLAEDTGADMLCIGIELPGVSTREEDWRRVIQGVRQRYSGPITYSSWSVENGIGDDYHDTNQILWWDALDYIGVTYFDLTDKNDPTVEELKDVFVTKGYLEDLESLSNQFGKPILISEIGYEPLDGANIYPVWMGRDAPLDMQEQADCYQATLEVLWDQSWFAGIFWWQWFADTEIGGIEDRTSTPFGKPAEDVLRDFYLNHN